MTSTSDAYPTRAGARPAILERADPVVWSPPLAPGPIQPADLASYAAEGFLEVPDQIGPDEVAELWDELDRMGRDDAVLDDERTVLEKHTRHIRSIFEVHRLSPVVARLVTDPRLADRARQILGSDVYVHQSRINYKPGFGGGSFYWHSDFETWHAEDGLPVPRAVSVSVALTENLPYNGALMIMPGSHRRFVACAGETPEDHFRSSLREQEVGTPDDESLRELASSHGIRQFTGPPGSATWFDANAMHGSNGNITPMPRANLFVVFNSVDNPPGHPYAAPRRRPSYIASRDLAPVPR